MNTLKAILTTVIIFLIFLVCIASAYFMYALVIIGLITVVFITTKKLQQWL